MLAGELEISGLDPVRRSDADVGLKASSHARHCQYGIGRKVMLLKDELPKHQLGVRAHRQAEPSVKMGIEHHIFSFLRLQLDFSGGRDLRLDAVWDLSPSVKPKDVFLRD